MMSEFVSSKESFMPSQNDIPDLPDMDEEEPEVLQGEEEEEKNLQSEPVEKEETHRPALVINVHSWATPIVAVLMLAIGLVGGYFGRPLIASQTQSEDLAAVQPTAQESVMTQSPAAAQPTVDDASRQQVMDFIVSQTKHFKGNPEAPITMIEFSDFQ
jgi:hypothetical protein